MRNDVAKLELTPAPQEVSDSPRERLIALIRAAVTADTGLRAVFGRAVT